MPKLILITGLPGAGKSSLGKQLAAQTDRGVFLSLEAVREPILHGILEGFTAELNRQLVDQRHAASTQTIQYLAEGRDVVVEDVCLPPGFLAQFEREFRTALSLMVFLNPDEEVLRSRLEARGEAYDVNFLRTLPDMYLKTQRARWEGWQVLDTSEHSPDDTFAEVALKLGWS